jgi:Cu/Zn superoxide dismutase
LYFAQARAQAGAGDMLIGAAVPYHCGIALFAHRTVVIDRLVAAVACLSLAACGGWNALSTSATGSGVGVQAVLKPAGSGAGQADVRFVDRGDGVFATIFVTNLLPGPYRVAIHQNANCSSPNLFSAGPAWAPPGSARPAKDLMPVFYTNMDGDGTWTVQIPGVHTTGRDSLQGRSVVLHAGTQIGDAVPDAPNDRVLCGVIGSSLSFFS